MVEERISLRQSTLPLSVPLPPLPHSHFFASSWHTGIKRDLLVLRKPVSTRCGRCSALSRYTLASSRRPSKASLAAGTPSSLTHPWYSVRSLSACSEAERSSNNDPDCERMLPRARWEKESKDDRRCRGVVDGEITDCAVSVGDAR